MNKYFKFVLYLIAIAVIAFIIIDVITPDYKKVHTVRYQVSGSAAKAFITYQTFDGSTEQIGEVDLPWVYQKDFVMIQEGTIYFSVLAQNRTNSGNITCDIYVNGTHTKSATSTGGHVIAHAFENVLLEK